MAATKCDCICVPRDEYERLKAQKGTQKTARKPKTVSAKAKTSKPRQKARQTQRIAEPKVMAIAEPKATAKKTAKKTTKKTTAKAKSKAVTKTKSKSKMNTVYEVDYPKSIPAPKKDVPYNGKVIERRTKAPKQVSAPRETVVVRETVKIEAPKESKVRKESELKKRAVATAAVVGIASRDTARRLNEARKERKAERLARREQKQLARSSTVYEVDYPKALPSPQQAALPAPSEPKIRQLENCEGKGFFAKRACEARNRKAARDY